MRRLLATSLVGLILLAAGCGFDLEGAGEVATYEVTEMRPQTVSLAPSIVIDVVLYFPNQARTKLATESRQLTLHPGEHAAAAIVQALLDGPQTSELRPVGSGLTLQRVEVMSDVINVYLERDQEFYMTNSELTAGKLAIATTLIDYAEVRCANVLLNGMQTAFEDSANGMNVPTGALTRVTDLVDEFNTLEQKAAAQNPDMYAVLYFLDAGESYLLPEIRKIVFPGDDDLVTTLIAQLQQGPDNSFSYQPVLDPALVLLSHSITTNADGNQIIRLVFNKQPVVYTNNFTDGEQMALAALAYTICDFIPNVAAIEVSARLTPRDIKTCSPEEFTELIGRRISICLPNTPNGVTMTTVERVLPQAEAAEPRSVLQALFEGPLGLDSRDVWPAIPEGISMNDVLDVYMAGDIMIVDFASTVPQVLAHVSESDERVMLFAIINTMTNFDNIRRVLFLVNGERTAYLGSEVISTLDPLMKNPGIMK